MLAERGGKMTLRENAEAHANNEFADTLMFYLNEETEYTPIEIAKIFIEEYSKVAFELAEEFKERGEKC